MGKKDHHHCHCDCQHHHCHVQVAGAFAPPMPYTNYPPPPEMWVSWLIPLFTIANILSFVYTMYLNDCPHHHSPSSCVFFPSLDRYSFEPLQVNPLYGPSSKTLDQMGSLSHERVMKNGEGWRLFSYIWLHAGAIHLLINMFSLLFIGVRLEEEFGFAKIGVLYLLYGFGGSLMSCLSVGRNMSVGACGAIFGLLGAMLSELITNWTIYANKCVALLTLIIVIIINLAVGVLPQVNSAANVGRFASGFLLGFILLMRPQSGWISHRQIPPALSKEFGKPKYKLYQYFLWLFAFVLLILG